jgi:polyisoprenoid-binding protein YceI
MANTTMNRTQEALSLIGTRWRIDPAHTTAEFAVKHMMITTVKGRFASVEGSLYVDEHHPMIPDLEVTIDAASIDTREAKRDEHLKSADFFDVARYPTIMFKAHHIDGDPMGEFRLYGDLIIRGVKRRIVLDCRFEGHTPRDPWGGERLGFSASGKLNRKDFDLRWNVALEAGGWLVGDDVKLMIDAQLVRVP